MNRRKSFAVERKERKDKERKEKKHHKPPTHDEPAGGPEGDDYKSFTMTGGIAGQSKVTEDMRRRKRMQVPAILFGIALMALFFVSVIIYVTVVARSGDPRQPRFVSPTPMASFRKWLVVAGDKLCQSEAKRMFDMNGTVGDAAVATMLCLCVVRPHRCGLGGGFLATYYNRQTQEARAVVAREAAPGSAFSDMYREKVNQSYYGFTAVAVFGELLGYEALLNLTGTRVPWKELFTKAIHYADNGFEVSENFAQLIQEHAQAISDDYTTTLKKILTNRRDEKIIR
ncbi:hypothetical protein HPB50_007669 [Hyalomma asiaticum]|uniref:Uncharacterized protein n=1 Tax=Hyalomma asiaticum TaxID=266040 RepID=A0ACB7SPG3_HYAAI|nr:hypothetical protein HPB50_007669 [Hyalomma asiaticum]